jgi:hypothetical protein
MSIKKQNIIIRLWWMLINPLIRKRPSDLGCEEDFQNFMEENNGKPNVQDTSRET